MLTCRSMAMHRTRGLRLAAAQLPGRAGPLAERLERAERAVAQALDADLVLLPEAFLPGYRQLPGDEAQARAARDWAAAAARRHHRTVGVGIVGPQGSELFLAHPAGGTWRYLKRFPTFAEARAWQMGAAPGLALTPLGRIGLVLCADLVQPATWRALAGKVDLVLVAAAWTDYGGRRQRLSPLGRAFVGPWMDRSPLHRDQLLTSAAQALRVPLVYANATGLLDPSGAPSGELEGFDGGSRILDGQGQVLDRVRSGEGLASAEVELGPVPGGVPRPPGHPLHWRVFSAVHRAAAKLRRVGRGSVGG